MRAQRIVPLLAVLAGCSGGTRSSYPEAGDVYCQTDDDCSTNACCGDGTLIVPASQAPSCQHVVCAVPLTSQYGFRGCAKVFCVDGVCNFQSIPGAAPACQPSPP